MKAWVFGDEHDPAKVWHLLDILERHDIKVYELARDISEGGSQFSAGKSYIIPGNQPQYRLVRSLFETRTSFTDSLFYDVSTWSLPHSFNLKHAELGSRAFSNNLLGSRVSNPAFPEGVLSGGEAKHAYVFEWDGYYAPRALFRLLDAGVRARVANASFTGVVNGSERTFRQGTILIPVGLQHDISSGTLYELMREINRKDAVDVYALNTGLSVQGVDLGSPSFSTLRKPEILLVVGNGVNVSEAGETWHQLDQRYHMPVTMVETDRFNSLNLDRYNTIILPNGNYGPISERGRENLRRWVSSGGVLIAYKGAINWLVNHNMASAGFVRGESENEKTHLPYADANQNRGAQVIGGSIFRTNLDLTHPLAYGYRNPELSVFRNSTIFLEQPSNRYAAPVRYTNAPLISGYISDQNKALIPNTASVVVSGTGSGRVILMADNPNFRAFWFGTNKLFANAIFFGHTINWATLERGEE